VYEVDFLAVKPDGKSGDAITARFSTPTGSQAVMVIDGGFTEIGNDIVSHIRRWYGTSYVDLVVNTHPDADHINGLTTVLEELRVGELLIHQPRQHGYSDAQVNPEAVDELVALARRRGVPVTEPFAGLQRFDGALTVLGPTQDYYEELLKEQLAGRTLAAVMASLYRKALVRTRRVLAALPAETLDDTGETTARNNTSVVTQLTVDGRRLLFTGDAGMPALHAAIDYADFFYLTSDPLRFFDVPHHGSRRNLGPAVLDRLLAGQHGVTAYVSASDSDPKHPSPKYWRMEVRAWWSCGLGELLCFVQAAQELVQVGAGEPPVERDRGLLIAALEAKQALLDLAQVGEVVGRQDFALDHREDDLDLVEPRGVHRQMDQAQVLVLALQPLDGRLATVG
jgi:beta-lactamase superfamily II metal-dependent hydrolase